MARVVEATGGSRRQGQDRMAAAVAEAVDTSRHLLVQAGTGTGKSWGYLVPAVAAAVRRGRGVVVATSTLALQGQLVRQDLPRLADALEGPLGRRPTWQLVKGRNNYVCKHRLAGGSEAEEDPLSLWEQQSGSSARSTLEQQVVRVREWAEQTDTGDRDDLVPGVPERAWRAVSVTARECLGQRCPLVGECFSEAARARAKDVDVVVTNHALLAIDATDNRKTLPQHDVVVVDEAHDLIDRVTAALSREVTAASVRSAATAARRAGCGADDVTDLDRAAAGLETALTTLSPVVWPTGHRPRCRTRCSCWPPRPAARCAPCPRTPRRAVPRRRGRRCSSTPTSPSGSAGYRRRRGSTATTTTRSPRSPRRPPGSTWSGSSRTTGAARCSGRPARRVRAAQARLFDARTVVATSATLTGPGGFDALARRLGLGRAGWTGLDVGSPFDYARQAILYVAPTSPPRAGTGTASPCTTSSSPWSRPRAAGRSGCSPRAAPRRRRRTWSGPGQTSPSSARARTWSRPWSASSPRTPDLPVRHAGALAGRGRAGPVVQPGRPRPRPVPPPDDPLSQARSEAVDRAGGNGFMTVSVAHAATLLAQGAGRLVRRGDDRGVVAVLDPRVATKRYGPALLQALPPFWRTTDREVVLGALRRLPR
jgi:ATP-dependent DNA helicase DinG